MTDSKIVRLCQVYHLNIHWPLQLRRQMNTLHCIVTTNKKLLYQNLVNAEILMRLPQIIWNPKKLCYKHFVFTCFSNI